MHPFGCLSPKRFIVVDIETSEGFDCKQVFGHGHYQKGLVLFAIITMWVLNSHTLAFALITAEVDHWCRQPNDVNISSDAWKSMAIPVEADGRHSRCTVYASPGDLNDTTVVECDSWHYDPERASSSIVPEWNLVCSRRLLKAIATGVFMASSLGFLVLSGYCSDRFGRLPVVRGNAFVVMVATVGCCFAKTYLMYVVARVFVSGSTMSLFIVVGTILAESCSFASRPTLLSFSGLMGLMLAETFFAVLEQVPHLSWFLRQLVMVAPTLLVPAGFFLIAESPRWLIASRKLIAAESFMLAAAKANGAHQEPVALLLKRVQQRLQGEEGATSTSTVATNMARVVRRRAVIMFASSFSVMIAFYSLLLYQVRREDAAAWMQWGPLCANAFAYFLLLKIVNRMDKTRLITRAYVILGSLCCSLSVTMVAAGGKSPFRLVSDLVFVITQAVCSVAMIFNFVYVIDLFPTTTRGVAVSLAFAFGRLGGMVGALITELARNGHDSLLFLLISAVVYSSAYSFHYLPLEYGTYAHLADGGMPASGMSSEAPTVTEMKQSLRSPPCKNRRSLRRSPAARSPKRSKSVTPIPSPGRRVAAVLQPSTYSGCPSPGRAFMGHP
ncbi:solute carrier family 22 member 6-like [Haemaphysalis longicornis]